MEFEPHRGRRSSAFYRLAFGRNNHRFLGKPANVRLWLHHAILLPGERAYTHRHSANAFRFILEAPDRGASTVVDGTRIPMQPGDLVMTPNWTWHDHHNESDTHAIWYDGLDVLMAYWLGGGVLPATQ